MSDPLFLSTIWISFSQGWYFEVIRLIGIEKNGALEKKTLSLQRVINDHLDDKYYRLGEEGSRRGILGIW